MHNADCAAWLATKPKGDFPPILSEAKRFGARVGEGHGRGARPPPTRRRAPRAGPGRRLPGDDELEQIVLALPCAWRFTLSSARPVRNVCVCVCLLGAVGMLVGSELCITWGNSDAIKHFSRFTSTPVPMDLALLACDAASQPPLSAKVAPGSPAR